MLRRAGHRGRRRWFAGLGRAYCRVHRRRRERGLVDCRAQLWEARLALEVGELLTLEAEQEFAVVVRGAAAFYEVPLGSTRGGDYVAVVAGRSWSPGKDADVRLRVRVTRRRGVVMLDVRADVG